MSMTQFESIVEGVNSEFIYVIDSSFSKSDYLLLDLSINNSELQSVNVSSSKDLGNYVNQHIKKNNKKVAYGGYIETRGIYSRSTYFNQKINPLDERNIHLGIDIWIDAGTNVLAVLDGEIHSFNNNTNHGDYGPTIILKHQIDNYIFYSLYGHLSEESLVDLKIGNQVRQGQIIAQLGSEQVNGDYPPHLHFQLIINIEDYKGDYPGVASKNMLEFYKNNCPDPNIVLGIE